mmetsp:Transcript_32492/g.36174  ORF Transcript_32492/g.36174 Transcript_32492/m.36174 type:complete len:133 (+) Transcript_32492:104-502(+)
MDTSFDSSDDYDGGLFTPSRGRRKSIVNDFTRTPPDSGINHQLATIEKTGNNNHINDVDVYTTIAPNTLPRLQDTSWLGARMSPIRQRPDDTEDKDDDDDDEVAAAAQKRTRSMSTKSNTMILIIMMILNHK